jgi:FixJ family two-component response regulator
MNDFIGKPFDTKELLQKIYDTLPRLCQQAARLHQQSASQLRAELEGL